MSRHATRTAGVLSRVTWVARGAGVGAVGAVFIAGLLASAGCGSSQRSAANSRPNIVFVVLDTLRADHLEFYGYEHSTAPFLARLAEESAVFTRAFSSSSWTAPSTASLFTGLYPTRHGVTMGFKAKVRRGVESGAGATIRVPQLPQSQPTLPEQLSRLGYRTYGIATNINIGAPIGFDRGFDRFIHLTDEPAENVLQTVRSWRGEMEGESPFFLYLHLDDVHKPYTQRAPWFAASGDPQSDSVAAYDSEIHYVDGQLEEMLALLGFTTGGARDGILLIASDHGEEFWDHGDDGHRFTLHYEVTRIALMVSGPGIQPGVVPDNVSGVDVLPTLLDLIGAPAPEISDGRSFAPLLRDAAEADALRAEFARRPLLAHRADRRDPAKELWSVVVGPWRLIVTPEGNQLYDLRSDTRELHDQSAGQGARVAALRAELDRFRQAKPIEPTRESTVRLDAEGLEQLKALGYVEDEAQRE